MKKRQLFTIITIVGIIAIIVIMFITIDTKKFQFQFEVDNSDSSIDVEKVILKGKLIKFPFNTYYIKGTLSVDEKVYIVEKYKRELTFMEQTIFNPYTRVIDTFPRDGFS